MKTPFRAWAAAAALAVAASPAAARMYQWVSPATGRMQLSGEPPAWYRAARDGPRVWVFENGSLVDDTAIALPRGQREELREAAFEASEERQRAEALRRLERAARREQRMQEEAERAAQREQAAAAGAEATTPPQAARGAGAAATAAGGPLDEATVERLKAIIRDFDRRGGG